MGINHNRSVARGDSTLIVYRELPLAFGSSRPVNPMPGHMVWRQDTQVYEYWDDTASAWVTVPRTSDHISNESGVTGATVTDALDRLEESRAPRENGFVDQTNSTLAIDTGTRTFTITPTGASFSYYNLSTLYTVSAVDSVVFPDTEGPHFFYYDGATLSTVDSFTPALITDYALVAVIYWNATDNELTYFGDERHGATMDSATHAYNHLTFGTRYGGGLTLQSVTADGSGDDDISAQIEVEDGTIWDEDIQVTITDGMPQQLALPAEIPVLYRSGAAGDWKRTTADEFPITNTGSGRMAWNEFTGGVWQLTEVGNNKFALAHLYATPDLNAPILAIVGRAEYATKNTAREGATTEVPEALAGAIDDISPEYIPIATLIYETSNAYTNQVKARVVSTDTGDDYISWLDFKGGAGASTGTSVVDSVFGRIGNVVAVAGDYGTDEITNDSTVTGALLTAALDNLLTSINTNASSISTNAGSISTNAGNIATNAGNIVAGAIAIATINGQISTLQGESVSKHEWIMPIWAEENAALGASNTYEWAYGNGADTPNAGGVPVYVPAGFSAEIVAMGLNIGSGTATVEAIISGVAQGATANVTVSTGRTNVNAMASPPAVVSGDIVNFRTTTSSGTAGPCVASMFIRVFETP